MEEEKDINTDLSMAAVQVTEAAAIAAAQLMGCGDEEAADQAALIAMYTTFQTIQMRGKICIGEKFEDVSSRLFVGDSVGTGDGASADIAVVPLEGKSILARGGPNALSLVALAENGGFLNFPDFYLDKIAIGSGPPAGTVDLDLTPEQNLNNLAESKKCKVSDLVVCLLDRPRNADIINQIRKVGARIRLILDGDVAGIIQAATPNSGIDVYMGIGGAQEGVLAAAALRGIGGQMQGRLVVSNAQSQVLAETNGIDDISKKFSCEDMAHGDITFAATGITYGSMLEGVRITKDGMVTDSLVVQSKSKILRYIKGFHKLD